VTKEAIVQQLEALFGLPSEGKDDAGDSAADEAEEAEEAGAEGKAKDGAAGASDDQALALAAALKSAQSKLVHAAFLQRSQLGRCSDRQPPQAGAVAFEVCAGQRTRQLQASEVGRPYYEVGFYDAQATERSWARHWWRFVADASDAFAGARDEDEAKALLDRIASAADLEGAVSVTWYSGGDQCGPSVHRSARVYSLCDEEAAAADTEKTTFAVAAASEPAVCMYALTTVQSALCESPLFPRRQATAAAPVRGEPLSKAARSVRLARAAAATEGKGSQVAAAAKVGAARAAVPLLADMVEALPGNALQRLAESRALAGGEGGAKDGPAALAKALIRAAQRRQPSLRKGHSDPLAPLRAPADASNHGLSAADGPGLGGRSIGRDDSRRRGMRWAGLPPASAGEGPSYGASGGRGASLEDRAVEGPEGDLDLRQTGRLPGQPLALSAEWKAVAEDALALSLSTAVAVDSAGAGSGPVWSWAMDLRHTWGKIAILEDPAAGAAGKQDSVTVTCNILATDDMRKRGGLPGASAAGGASASSATGLGVFDLSIVHVPSLAVDPLSASLPTVQVVRTVAYGANRRQIDIALPPLDTDADAAEGAEADAAAAETVSRASGPVDIAVGPTLCSSAAIAAESMSEYERRGLRLSATAATSAPTTAGAATCMASLWGSSVPAQADAATAAAAGHLSAHAAGNALEDLQYLSLTVRVSWTGEEGLKGGSSSAELAAPI
jgi:hypothetical protein